MNLNLWRKPAREATRREPGAPVPDAAVDATANVGGASSADVSAPVAVEPAERGASDVASVVEDPAPSGASTAKPQKKSWLFRKVTDKAVDGGPDSEETTQSSRLVGLRARFSGGEKRAFSAVPIRVIIGYLPEVTERDALDYAMGIADKHFEQLGLAYFDAFEYDGGYVFEAHEGGHGKAYAPQILEYFTSQGPFKSTEVQSVVIRTATRKVEVQRARQGLTAVILPESSDMAVTEWLAPTAPMTPALNKRTGLLVSGAALFVTGFAALVIAAFVARFQPYEPPPRPTPEVLTMQDLPSGQWTVLQSVEPGRYVKALRYRNGKWEPLELTAVEPSTGNAALEANALITEAQLAQAAVVATRAEGKPVPPRIQGLIDTGKLSAGQLSKLQADTPLAGAHLRWHRASREMCQEVEAVAGRDRQLERLAQPPVEATFGCFEAPQNGPESFTFFHKL